MVEFYLDANAGLPARPESLAEFARVAALGHGNPASLHRPGRRAHGELERAREATARCLRCSARELVFTGGATESCNLGILGVVRGRAALTGKKQHLVSSLAEHPAVLGPLRVLQQEGHRLQLLPIDAHACVDQHALAEVLQEGCDFVAMQWANNETGVIQPIELLAEQLPFEANWHCDAVQGFGKLAWNSALESADSLTVSGHKFGSPHGVGAWVLRDATLFEAPLSGGGHQGARRPGTENPEAAAALAVALQLAEAELEQNQQLWREACSVFLQAAPNAGPEFIRHHSDTGGLPNTLNLGFPGLDGRMLLPALDAEGVAVSAGSACSSGSPEPSAVLLAAGVSEDLARASLRISFPPAFSGQQAALAAQALWRTLQRVYEVADL